MRVLFVLPHRYLPEFRGGEEISIDAICRALSLQGTRCAVLCKLSDNGLISMAHKFSNRLHRYFKGRPDTVLGYPTYRVHDISEILDRVLDHFLPTVIVFQKYVQEEWLDAASRRSIPCCFYFHDAGLKWTAVQPGQALTFIANSQFTASLVEQYFGRPAKVVYPIIWREKYETTVTGRNVLFVNPTQDKGLEIALHLARARGDVSFIFQESWKLPNASRAALNNSIAALPNVTYVPATRDIRNVYRQTRLLLVPSQVRETWGRVATEAQFSGIPALASSIGGLSESVGPAGVLVAAKAPMSSWLQAFNSIWDDPTRHSALVCAARDYSLRPEINPVLLVERLVRILQAA